MLFRTVGSPAGDKQKLQKMPLHLNLLIYSNKMSFFFFSNIVTAQFSDLTQRYPTYSSRKLTGERTGNSYKKRFVPFLAGVYCPSGNL